MVTVNFSVSVPFQILEGQSVFVTGATKKLGSWNARKALQLKKGKDGRWNGVAKFPVIDGFFNYIYFVGSYIKSEEKNENILAISKWEILLKPRCITSDEISCYTQILLRDVFGEEGEDISYGSNKDFDQDDCQIALKKPLKLCRKREWEDFSTCDIIRNKNGNKKSKMVKAKDLQDLQWKYDGVKRELAIEKNSNEFNKHLIRTSFDYLIKENTEFRHYLFRQQDRNNFRQPTNQHAAGDGQFGNQSTSANARQQLPILPMNPHRYGNPETAVRQHQNLRDIGMAITAPLASNSGSLENIAAHPGRHFNQQAPLPGQQLQAPQVPLPVQHQNVLQAPLPVQQQNFLQAPLPVQHQNVLQAPLPGQHLQAPPAQLPVQHQNVLQPQANSNISQRGNMVSSVSGVGLQNTQVQYGQYLPTQAHPSTSQRDIRLNVEMPSGAPFSVDNANPDVPSQGGDANAFFNQYLI
ncbi:hypothetical protein ACQ4LE_009520 [Meloidogyne hapla]|uniref:CBM20 domain-containing protein n=1 Tax=Meloidogyne hapla TaxID=6305 RepID=A0A1I8BCP3_MELHA